MHGVSRLRSRAVTSRCGMKTAPWTSIGRNVDDGPVAPLPSLAMLLEGKVVIVSGVGPGLGRECAVAAAREGASVVLGARRRENLEKAAAECDPDGKTVAWK